VHVQPPEPLLRTTFPSRLLHTPQQHNKHAAQDSAVMSKLGSAHGQALAVRDCGRETRV
jgi:hypothetical protein